MNDAQLAERQARAARRRATWKGGVAKSFAEIEERDLDAWLAVSPADRMRTVWSITEDALVFQGYRGPTPRLQRSAGGVRSR